MKKGFRHSEESKRKIGEASALRRDTEATIIKKRMARLGKPIPEDVREKIKESNKETWQMKKELGLI